jgi:hypothetical protein
MRHNPTYRPAEQAYGQGGISSASAGIKPIRTQKNGRKSHGECRYNMGDSEQSRRVTERTILPIAAFGADTETTDYGREFARDLPRGAEETAQFPV